LQNHSGRLTFWNVFVRDVKGEKTDCLGLSIGLSKRSSNDFSKRSSKLNDSGTRRIKVLTDPNYETVDISDENYQQSLLDKRKIHKDAKTPGRWSRNYRDASQGLILIYPLKMDDIHTDEPYIGFAISFPTIANERRVKYQVNSVWMSPDLLKQAALEDELSELDS